MKKKILFTVLNYIKSEIMKIRYMKDKAYRQLSLKYEKI